MNAVQTRALHNILLTEEDLPARTEGSTRRHWVRILAVLMIAELVVTFLNPTIGLLTHAGLLIALVWMATLNDGPAHDLLVALAVLPLVRLLAISMPYWMVDQPSHFALVNLPLIAATFVAARYLRYGRVQLGLTLGGLAWQWPVVASGVVIGFVERLIIQPAALAPDLSFASVWWPALSLLLFTGLSEEILFRGTLQTAAVRVMGARWGIVYVSLMFGVLHIGWQSLLDVAFVTAVGLFFGFVVHRTGSILGVALAHGAANIVLFIVLPNLLA